MGLTVGVIQWRVRDRDVVSASPHKVGLSSTQREWKVVVKSHGSHDETWQGECPSHVPHGCHEVEQV